MDVISRVFSKRISSRSLAESPSSPRSSQRQSKDAEAPCSEDPLQNVSSCVIEPESYAELCEILNNKTGMGLVLLDFAASWCPPCQTMAPVFAELSKLYKGRVAFVKVDVDVIPESAVVMEVNSMPLFVAMKGEKEIARVNGADKRQLENLAIKLAACG